MFIRRTVWLKNSAHNLVDRICLKINIPKIGKKSMNFKLSRYGWFPDLPGHRDYLYATPVAFTRALPVKADLRLKNVRRFTIRDSSAAARPRQRHCRRNHLASDFWTIRIVA
jgi:hypothetical protein